MNDFSALLGSHEPHAAFGAAVESDSADIRDYRDRLHRDGRIVALVRELQSWPGPRINSHKSAGQFFHKLVFLADIGLDKSFPGIREIIGKILSSLDDDGIPCIEADVPVAYGGSGETTKAWALCDAPSTLYSLVRLGIVDERIHPAVDKPASLSRENGFGCAVSKSLGTWRGPGKQTDPCPYATLITLKLLLLFGDEYGEEISASAESILDLWEHSRTKHPYIFYMRTDFRKLKLPFIWYDVLHVVDVLSRIERLRSDARLGEMMGVIKEKEGEEGYIPDSVYQAWKEWDFGQKKKASDWMTF
jgi:hypothetical protein